MIASLRRISALLVCLVVAGAASSAPRLVPKTDVYNPPPASSAPSNFTRVGTKFFFTAFTLETGRELWITDGTAAGTVLVKDLTAGTGSTAIRDMVEFKGQLYFITNEQLWRSNGTAAGTLAVKAVRGGTLISAGSLLYILAPGSYASASEMWVSDGTAERTLRVRTFWQPIEYPFGDSGKLYFVTREDTLLGRQLWTSDGTLFGTRVLAPGITCATGVGCQQATFFRVGTKVLVLTRAAWGYTPPNLWQTDGTTAGTQLIRSNAGTLVAANSTTAYVAADRTLIKTDGTTAGTSAVATVAGQLMHGALAGSKLFMQVTGDNYFDRHLWTSNGTAAGTVFVTPIGEQPSGYYGDGPVASSSRYFFRKVWDGNDELWTSDGTAGGTVLVNKFTTGGGTAAGMAFLTSAGNYILFAARTAIDGMELWRSDGTTAGTYMIKNIATDALTGEITGTVRDSVSGAPIAGATVHLNLPPGSAPVTVQTGADGTYRIDRLTTDKYYLRVTSPGGSRRFIRQPNVRPASKRPSRFRSPAVTSPRESTSPYAQVLASADVSRTTPAAALRTYGSRSSTPTCARSLQPQRRRTGRTSPRLAYPRARTTPRRHPRSAPATRPASTAMVRASRIRTPMRSTAERPSEAP